ISRDGTDQRSRVGFGPDLGYRPVTAQKTLPSKNRRNAVNKHAAPLSASILEALARYDTPTICNAMEIVAPERRLIGYTTKALGCLGVITDGSIRDIPQWAPGFQALAGSIGPSHAWVHAENFGGEVRVAGMTVRSDDLIHADQHGAIVIPTDIAAKIPEACEL